MRNERNGNLLAWTILSALFVLVLGSKTFATTEFQLIASDGYSGDNFGESVSISGNVALIGSEGDDDNGDGSGSVYVFRWNGSSWVEEQKLLASDGAAEDNFGQSVSISGDVALVGAEGDDDRGSYSGSAYIFRWNGSNWVEEQKLLASDGAEGDWFGTRVSISGDVALMGAYSGDGMSTDSGSAYIFRWNGNNWVEEQKLFASDGASEDGFGGSVTISGDVALIGASEEEKDLPGSGMAYVFRWNGVNWVEEQKLRASDSDAGDQFGQAVAISGNIALVGAEQIEFVPGSGKAYVFRWNGSSWVEEQKLLASDGAVGDRFGYSVSISGNVALVGAAGDDGSGSESGSAYVFDFRPMIEEFPWVIFYPAFTGKRDQE